MATLEQPLYLPLLSADIQLCGKKGAEWKQPCPIYVLSRPATHCCYRCVSTITFLQQTWWQTRLQSCLSEFVANQFGLQQTSDWQTRQKCVIFVCEATLWASLSSSLLENVMVETHLTIRQKDGFNSSSTQEPLVYHAALPDGSCYNEAKHEKFAPLSL
jgi:hypothetical protein